YVVFGVILALSMAIGMFSAWKARRNKRDGQTEEFLLGGRNLHFIPVAFSIIATSLSAVAVLGIPTEVYVNGSMYWLRNLCAPIVGPLAAHVFVPLYHKLRLT
ncbi:unnamed protein product, partial [Owenia fusiformis]